ncbi:MAG TPA: iron chelate uptake ABC transporter family permease subunit [Nocardioides sp.]|nr:iron chelate uptake ABC transporter family permease subunit [Nocardioides sp.]
MTVEGTTLEHSFEQRPDDTAYDVALAGVRRSQRRRLVRRTLVSIALALVTLGTIAFALTVGDFATPIRDVLDVAGGGGDRYTRLAIIEFRIPPILLAVLAGAAFGLSGGLFQSSLRNPLASPDVIGITAGASVCAVAGTVLWSLEGLSLSAAALVGALGIAAVNLALSWRGGVTGYRFVLCGVALSFMCASVLGYLITRARIEDARSALVWMTGSVSGATDEGNLRLAIALTVLAPLALLLARSLDILELGDEVAVGLGTRAGRTRVAAIVIGSLLAAVATAAAGPIAFVALTAGPIARRLVGDGRPALIQAALVGVLVVVLSDVVAQHAFDDLKLPVGVVTGAVGGPYLIWLLATSQPSRRT